MRFLVSALIWLAVLVTGVSAKAFPDHADLFVNDLAGVITPDSVAVIRSDLARLKAETGVEMTVLTIPTRADYDPAPSVEAFATGLFNAWGIGDRTRNDGILILVATVDREMRIELGSGYNQDYDALAQDIVSRYVVPAFRDARYGDGIAAAVSETAARIARRHAAQLPPEALPAKGGLPAWPFVGGFAALFAGLIFRSRIGDSLARFRSCPQCGQRGLHRHRVIVTPATTTVPGVFRDDTWCSHCSWRDRHDSIIPVSKPGGSGGSFGGGKSSGGGATGRW